MVASRSRAIVPMGSADRSQFGPRLGRPAHMIQHQAGVELGRGARQLRFEGEAGRVVDDFGAEFQRTFRTSALYVSTEIGMVSLSLSRFSTGMRRRISSAAEMRADPGRVDSAPMSMMSEPCSSTRWRAHKRGRGRRICRRRKRIGRDITEPIITVRSPSRISRCFSFQKKSFLTYYQVRTFRPRPGRPRQPATRFQFFPT